MSLPSHNGGQSSIRSFFQPKQPTYAAPPSAAAASQAAAAPAEVTAQQQQQQPPVLQERSNQPSPQQPVAVAAAADPLAAAPPPSVAIPGAKPTHHPNITISPILPSHIPSLRRITARLLPVRYSDSFYAALSDPDSSGAFSRVLLWTDENNDASNNNNKPTVIGGLVCRPEKLYQPRPDEPFVDAIPNALYIQSLVLNEPYRRLGLAGALLNEVCGLAARDARWACRTVCAHVWTQNSEGMAWYVARGFSRIDPPVDAYYRMLTPNDAWIVRREIGGGSGGVLDTLQQQQQQQQQQNYNKSNINGQSTAAMTNGGSEAASRATPAVMSFTNSSPLPSPNGLPPWAVPRDPGRAPSPASGQSFQNARPETEWNDLPAEMSRTLAVPGSGVSSGASSRSSSTLRKKRDRAYPAAAFGVK
ncbi:GCN5-related N acetyltransferase [Apiospora aurea]|uniref:GCN5-related N acetyltransferase n=1 Tax=Apiospora aurea TaxID=335848 RepID=A0ABR1QRI5_9PEZI